MDSDVFFFGAGEGDVEGVGCRSCEDVGWWCVCAVGVGVVVGVAGTVVVVVSAVSLRIELRTEVLEKVGDEWVRCPMRGECCWIPGWTRSSCWRWWTRGSAMTRMGSMAVAVAAPTSTTGSPWSEWWWAAASSP